MRWTACLLLFPIALHAQNCDPPPELGGAQVEIVASSIDSSDGVISLTIIDGIPVSAELEGLNESDDYVLEIGSLSGIAPGSYHITVKDSEGCESNSVALVVPFALCCGDCGTYDTDVDGICDNEDNCINRQATNYNDPGNNACIIHGCTDAGYVEYHPDATEDDGSCSIPVVLGCTNPSYIEFSLDANTDDGSCAFLIMSNCLSPTMDGYDYDVVQIGNQCWFAENLQTEVYADGTVIPEITDNTAWWETQTGARCDYDNSAANVLSFGRLYNAHAAISSAGLCPSGWHVPTNQEWTELEEYITSQGAIGTALKSQNGWNQSGNGTDDFGFSGYPGGFRYLGSLFIDLGNRGMWWSSSAGYDNAWYRSLYYSNTGFGRAQKNMRYGFSVRCLMN